MRAHRRPLLPDRPLWFSLSLIIIVIVWLLGVWWFTTKWPEPPDCSEAGRLASALRLPIRSIDPLQREQINRPPEAKREHRLPVAAHIIPAQLLCLQHLEPRLQRLHLIP